MGEEMDLLISANNIVLEHLVLLFWTDSQSLLQSIIIDFIRWRRNVFINENATGEIRGILQEKQ